MELNAGTWKDVSHHQICDSQTLTPAKGCVAETPGEQVLLESLIQKADLRWGGHLRIYKASQVTAELSHPPALNTHTLFL